MPLASAHVLLWLALLAVPACADQGEGPQAVCEDTRVIRNVSPDECQSDADCPSDLVCALDLVSEDLTCQPAEDRLLQLWPTPPTIFFSPNTCIPPTSVLLINQSDETIRIDALQTENFALVSDSPQDGEGELIASAELPQELAPLDSLAIDFQFVTDTPEILGIVDLVVLTSKGCERLAVRAIRTGQTGFVHPLAVDLGTASPGTLGEPVDIVFTAFEPNEGTNFLAGGVSDEIFRVANPIDLTPLRSCEPLSTSVRFDAPLETGVYEGELFYEILTDGFSGIGVVFLRARVQ